MLETPTSTFVDAGMNIRRLGLLVQLRQRVIGLLVQLHSEDVVGLS